MKNKEIRNPQQEDLGMLAQAYIEAFGEEAWSEEHDLDEVVRKFELWTQHENYQVKVALRNNEFAGFAVTRIVPQNEIVENLLEEMREVSGIVLNETELEEFTNKLSMIKNSSEQEVRPDSEVGVFQDVVVVPKFRGSTTYIDLMFPMTLDLLRRDNLSMMVVYTNSNVGTVVNTLEMLGGQTIYSSDSAVVYAATKTSIIEKLKELGQWEDDTKTNDAE